MQTVDFDPSAYMTTPRLDVPSLIALGRQLLAAAPADLPRSVQPCKKSLRAALRGLEEGYKATQSEDPVQRKRPIDQRTDNAWACVKARLEPYTWLDEADFPEFGPARALWRKLFPTGLSFTQLEYGAQWAEASWRMQLIADEQLEPELRRLCGEVYIDELVRWHKEYSLMVGVVPERTASRADAARPNLAELRRQAAQAIVAWQAQLVAQHLAGHPSARRYHRTASRGSL
ncbi:MAG TPA: hypothetical protein PLW65_08865, partial [Pseudomonadota bacterium]|nr:hypothetical protein [Pseudomonadota bacterium]